MGFVLHAANHVQLMNADCRGRRLYWARIGMAGPILGSKQEWRTYAGIRCRSTIRRGRPAAVVELRLPLRRALRTADCR